MPGRCPTRAAGDWAGPARSTRWPTYAGTPLCTTRGPPAARPGGGTTACCRTSSAASTPRAGTRRCAGPAARSGSRRSRKPAVTPPPVALAEALCALGYPVTGDLSGSRQEGVAWPDLAIWDGRRVSPADAYLLPAVNRPNLTVLGGCLVTRLLIRGGRCAGAAYLRDGVPQQAHASAEVIVCAGAVGSPQLLMLSGIGPAEHLRGVGIDPVADLPGTGANLQDHPVAMACYASAVALPRSRYNHGETYSALSSPLAGAWPDLQLFPILLPVAPPGLPAPAGGFALVASAVAPDSRGIGPPGLRQPARRAADRSRLPARARATWTGWRRPGHDPPGCGRRRLRAARRDRGPPRRRGPRAATCGPGSGARSSSYYHPAGTCRIGPGTDHGAVTDPELRVHGITGLRVADASVMPLIPNAPRTRPCSPSPSAPPTSSPAGVPRPRTSPGRIHAAH